MAGPALRRRFRVVFVAEGDTWEAAGEAATQAIVVLNRGNPSELPKDGTPFEVKASNIGDTYGWKVEISQDEKMTHEAYVDLRSQMRASPAPEGDGSACGQ